jgi:type IV pilus biogenesis protein CpaD/CtpE
MVRFPAGSSAITAAEAGRLGAFLDGLPVDRRLTVLISGRAGERTGGTAEPGLSSRRAAQVAAAIRAQPGLAQAEIAMPEGPLPELPGDRGRPAAATPEQQPRADILVTAWAVALPGCPDWSRDPAYDPRNLPLSNLGCANAVNLGLMVADTGDLVRGREPGPADGTREAEAVVRYRTDKVKQPDTDILQP